MTTLITVIHIVTCIFLVIFVLLQSGKGAEISASFGGSSQTVFGSSGGANFFVKLTGSLAAVFFATSLLLTVMGSQSKKSLFESLSPTAPTTTTTTTTAPATPSKAAPAQGSTGSAPRNSAPAPAAPAQH